jgi:dihydrodipicolinate synthase/N-acetylneuraminate lyase
LGAGRSGVVDGCFLDGVVGVEIGLGLAFGGCGWFCTSAVLLGYIFGMLFGECNVHRYKEARSGKEVFFHVLHWVSRKHLGRLVELRSKTAISNGNTQHSSDDTRP